MPDLFAGFAEGKGLAKASPTELILEFVVRDSLVNLLKSRLKEIRIPRTEIDMRASGLCGRRLLNRRILLKFRPDQYGVMSLQQMRCELRSEPF